MTKTRLLTNFSAITAYVVASCRRSFSTTQAAPTMFRCTAPNTATNTEKKYKSLGREGGRD